MKASPADTAWDLLRIVITQFGLRDRPRQRG